MPWKDRYTTTDEKSLDDDEVRWPEGRRCCFTVVVDLSLATTPDGVQSSDFSGARAMFGLEDGLAQLLSLFERHQIAATFTVPAVMARMLAPHLRELNQAGHEIALNGLKHEDVSELAEAEESQRIDLAVEILTEVIGQRPQGWFSLPRQNDPFALGTVSDNTIALLREKGFLYFGNGPADDIPHYWVADFARAEALLTLPYYYHFDDQFFAMFPHKGTGLEHVDSLARNWRAEFDAQYKRGRQFAMTLHPHAIGWCNRAQLLDEFLAHVGRLPDVWNPTSAACAEYWQDTYPAQTTLKLEPSIWRDYPDSLS